MSSESEGGKALWLKHISNSHFYVMSLFSRVSGLSTCCCHMFGPSAADYLVISLRQRPSRSLISTLAFSSAVTLLPRWSPGVGGLKTQAAVCTLPWPSLHPPSLILTLMNYIFFFKEQNHLCLSGFACRGSTVP